jgi:serine/threonine-protein kinase
VTSGSEDPTLPIDGASSRSSASGERSSWVEELQRRFELRGELGRGATAVVFRALERATGREVALKVAEGALDAKRQARFEREGELTARLEHPGIVTVHAAGQVGGRPWIAYEMVTGAGTLGAAMLGADLRRRVELLRDVARALGHAHALGVVHRDVKPDNVLVDEAGRVRVADFGLAGAVNLERLTQTGAMIGTPSYMAPEQYEGRREEIGPATDVWALGVMLYEALSGELPFQGTSLLALGAEITEARPTPPSKVAENTVPVGLETLALRCLQADARERPPHGEAFATALDGWLRGEGTGVEPVAPGWLRWLVVAGAVAALVVAVGLVASRDEAGPGSDDGVQAVASPVLPRLTLLEPVADGEVVVVGSRLRVVVEVEAPEGSRLRVGGRTVRVREPRVEVEVELDPGLQPVLVRLIAPDHEPRELQLQVRCFEAPPWYLALSEEDSPWVPPGRFEMGSDRSDPMGESESPVHSVTLTRGFFLGKVEVSWSQYRVFCRETERPLPDYAAGVEGDHPAWGLTWQEARDYCAWAGGRLPTEAEWEWAARGPDGRPFPWGTTPPNPRQANLRDGGQVDRWESTAPVGSFPAGASPFGVEDLIGNVWEWVSDYLGPYEPGAKVDPKGRAEGLPEREAGQGVLRVMRGGGWNSDALSGEFYNSPSLGVRLAVDARD